MVQDRLDFPTPAELINAATAQQYKDTAAQQRSCAAAVEHTQTAKYMPTKVDCFLLDLLYFYPFVCTISV